MNDCPYLAIWEFEIKIEFRAQFEDIYGPDGAWARLFRQSPDYLGTKLTRDLTRPGRHLTFDCWTSREAFRNFKRARAAEYESLDKQCESFTEREMMVGEFQETTVKPEDKN